MLDRHYRYEWDNEITLTDSGRSSVEARARRPNQEWRLGSRQLFAKTHYLWRV
jgi:hypothetical protein